MKRERQEKILELISTRQIGTQEELTEGAGAGRICGDPGNGIPGHPGDEADEGGHVRRETALCGIPGDASESVGRNISGFSGMDFCPWTTPRIFWLSRRCPAWRWLWRRRCDHMEFQEIVGSIAGDDTIMCAVRSVEDTVKIMERLRGMIAGDE